MAVPVGSFNPEVCLSDGEEVPFFVDDVEIEAEDRLYLALGPCGFGVVEVEGEGVITSEFFDMPGWVEDVEVDSGYLFIAQLDGGLAIVEEANPGVTVATVGFVDDEFGFAIDVEVLNGVAYVATTTGLQIIDVSIPEEPVWATTYPVNPATGALQDVEIAVFDEGTRVVAFLSSWFDGMVFVDVTNSALASDPQPPQMLAAIASESATFEITVMGGLAMVADGDTELRLFDVSDPEEPFELPSFPTDGYAWDVEFTNDGGNLVGYVSFGDFDGPANMPRTGGIQVVHGSALPVEALMLMIPEPSPLALGVAVIMTLGLMRWMWVRSPRNSEGLSERL